MFVEFFSDKNPVSVSLDKIICFLPEKEGNGTEIRVTALNSLGYKSIFVDQDYAAVKNKLYHNTSNRSDYPNRPKEISLR